MENIEHMENRTGEHGMLASWIAFEVENSGERCMYV